MSAPQHADRFLAACPEDVRAAVTRRHVTDEGITLTWASDNFFVGRVDVVIGHDGRCAHHIVRGGWYVDPSRYGHLDRLLGSRS